MLLDGDGHVRLGDFGLSKILRVRGSSGGTPPPPPLPPPPGTPPPPHPPRQFLPTRTFCGNRESLAPEVIAGSPYGQAVDWWALGVLVYELLVGRPAFGGGARDEIYDRISRGALTFPRCLSDEAVALVRGLLDRNAATRLGGAAAGGVAGLCAHPWFDGVDWALVHKKVRWRERRAGGSGEEAGDRGEGAGRRGGEGVAALVTEANGQLVVGGRTQCCGRQPRSVSSPLCHPLVLGRTSRG